jgi:hypothetical protein
LQQTAQPDEYLIGAFTGVSMVYISVPKALLEEKAGDYFRTSIANGTPEAIERIFRFRDDNSRERASKNDENATKEKADDKSFWPYGGSAFVDIVRHFCEFLTEPPAEPITLCPLVPFHIRCYQFGIDVGNKAFTDYSSNALLDLGSHRTLGYQLYDPITDVALAKGHAEELGVAMARIIACATMYHAGAFEKRNVHIFNMIPRIYSDWSGMAKEVMLQAEYFVKIKTRAEVESEYASE